jgi:hypothetical protein
LGSRDAATITDEKTKLTSHIEIVGTGRSKHRHHFVKLLLKGRKSPVLIRYDNLHSNRNATFEWLNQQGAHLIDTTAQNELIKRIQAYGPRPSSFKVAEEIGLFEDCVSSCRIARYQRYRLGWKNV